MCFGVRGIVLIFLRGFVLVVVVGGVVSFFLSIL